MSDFFDDLNVALKKDIIPNLKNILKKQDKNISDKFNQLINDPKSSLNDILATLTNKDNLEQNQSSEYIEKPSKNKSLNDQEYDELLNRLKSIKVSMEEIEKYLKR